MNTTTPRIFIAATAQDEGKTTMSLGLFHTLKKRLGAIGYIKPIGQRFIEFNGLQVDEDSFLMERTYNVQVPLEDMSPITVNRDFTRNFLKEGNSERLEVRIKKAFDRTAWEKKFVIIEGSGHAGVGSLFGLNNACVARLLRSKVLIVTRGGIGAPVDEVALNLALFEKHGVEVVGVILNRVLPAKQAMIQEIAEKAFRRLQLPVFGVVPKQNILLRPTIGQIAAAINGKFLCGENYKRRRADQVVLGAMTSSHLADHFTQDTLVITPGDRDDIIMSALLHGVLAPEKFRVVGIVLTRDMVPSENLRQLMARAHTPIILTPWDSYQVVSMINQMSVKTEPDDKDKIELIQKLTEEYVDINRLMLAVGVTDFEK